MKTKMFLGGLLFTMILGMTGCHKHRDKDPEIVIDPMKDTREYYIAGSVIANDVPLAGVTVKSDNRTVSTDAEGKYKLTVSSAATYAVTFVKDGYLTIDNAVVVIANTAANRSFVTLNVKMSKESPKVQVAANAATVVSDKGVGSQAGATAVLDIPQNAVKTATQVSVTPCQEPAFVSTEVKAGTSTEPAAITNIRITTTENIVLNEPVTLTVNNKASENIYFDEVEVYSKKGTKAAGDWQKEADAVFDPTVNGYKFSVGKGKTLAGEYSVRVKNTKVTGNKTIGENNIEPVKVSNAGNMNAIIDYKINFEAWAGWSYTLSPENALKSIISNETDIQGMAAMIHAAIEAQEGTSGTYKVPYSLTTNISGNYIMYYTNKSNYCIKKYTFRLNGNKSVNIELKYYTGMTETYINEDANQHSGGEFGE